MKNKVEQWRVVVDLEDCSITSAPIGILKQVCDTLTVSYTSFRINEGLSIAFFRAKFFVASKCERTQFESVQNAAKATVARFLYQARR